MTKAQDTDPARVRVFFYGTFMSTRVLREHGIECDSTVPAVLHGFKLTISSRANLEEDASSKAYGGLADIKESEIDSLYEGLLDESSLVYRPRTVLAETLAGEESEAVCYFCDDMSPGTADPKYVEEMVACCKELGLPDDYIQHVSSFRT